MLNNFRVIDLLQWADRPINYITSSDAPSDLFSIYESSYIWEAIQQQWVFMVIPVTAACYISSGMQMISARID